VHSKQQELASFESKLLQTEERNKALTREIARLSAEYGELTVGKGGLHNQLAVLLQAYELEFNEKRWREVEDCVKNRLDQYRQQNKLLNQYKIDVGRLDAEFQSLKGAQLEKKGKLQEQQSNLLKERTLLDDLRNERKLRFGDKDPGAERRMLNSQLQQAKQETEKLGNDLQLIQQTVKVNVEKKKEWMADLQMIEERYKNLYNQLMERLATEGIESVEALEADFISAKEEQEISELKQGIDLQITTATAILQSIDEELQAEAKRQLTTDTEETLVVVVKETESLLSAVNQQIGALQHKIEEDQKTQAKYKEVAAEVEREQKELFRWEKLAHLIGSADGKKFSKFAQGLTLSFLTQLANRHLQKLSDRYQILKSNDKDLELQIVDLYQAEVIRPMASLSGGESFLVSLALALGLSDLAGNKTRINSLFIDEGFGTLDADTLDVAITALENLQASGKTIGIISHVEALKERIGTQIEVSKQAGGYSKIRVKNYVNSE